MSDTLDVMSRKMNASSKLRAVVRIIKIIAASQIRECQRSALASENYYRNIRAALCAFFKKCRPIDKKRENSPLPLVAIVFGTDQGLVGSFNDRLAKHVVNSLKESNEKKVFVVGKHLGAILDGLGVHIDKAYPVPRSTKEIPSALHELLIDIGSLLIQDHERALVLLHNRPVIRQLFEPVSSKLLPLDEAWTNELMNTAWPTNKIPEILEDREAALLSLLKEYLFAAFARSLAESMACENLIRLLSMQKAEKNIDDMLADLSSRINLIRQSAIDAELFDVISGFFSLSNESDF